MKKLIQVLRDRRGESMVEILVSAVVFMLLLGALNGAVGFASNAQRKAEQLREDAVVLQREVRASCPPGRAGQSECVSCGHSPFANRQKGTVLPDGVRAVTVCFLTRTRKAFRPVSVPSGVAARKS